MITVTYTPILDGAAYDPVDNGGDVVTVELFIDPARSVSAATAGPATKTATGVYEFTVDVPPGRYWPTVTWQPDSDPDTVVDDYLDFMDAPGAEVTGLVVSPEAVGVELGLGLPLTAAQRSTLTTQIRASQGRVRAYLNRPLIPERRTFTNHVPDTRYDTLTTRAWPGILEEADDRFEVLSATESSGVWTVVALVGLDCVDADETQIVRDFITADAADRARTTPELGLGERVVTSVSADGQSVSYERRAQAPAGGIGGARTGAPMTLQEMQRFRRRTVYTSPRVAPRFPYVTVA